MQNDAADAFVPSGMFLLRFAEVVFSKTAVQTKDEENNGTLETSITENSDSPTHLQNPPDEQGLQIDMDQVQLGDAILGRGSFSIVHSGTYKDEPIAVKTINTGSLTITPQDALRSVSILA